MSTDGIADTKTVVPKYYQVEQALRNRIATLPAGTALSSEPELSREYAVSRTTLRIAVEALVSDGLLARIQGKGTFVTGRALEYPLGYHARSAVPAPDELTHHRVLTISRQPAGDEFGQLFRIPDTDIVLRVERVSLSSDIPMGIGTLIVPLSLAPKLADTDFSQGRFFYTLADHGVEIARHKVVIESLIIDRAMASQLGIRSGLPGIGLTRFGMGRHGATVAYVRIVTRGDIGRYVLEFEHGPWAAMTSP